MTSTDRRPVTVVRTAARPAGRGYGRIQLGQPVTLGSTTAADLLVLAAAAAPGSADPVDLALQAGASALAGEAGTPTVTLVELDPARPDRRVSVTRVQRPRTGEPPGLEEITILRGELGAVMSAAGLGPDRRLVVQKNASFVERRGYRPLAVASSTLGRDGVPGPMQVHGFVPVRTVRARGFQPDAVGRPAEWVRVPVWPASLRWMHWLNVAAIVALTVTGFYIADPFFRPGPAVSPNTGYFMGYVRLVHYSVAWAWVTLGLVRLYLLFFSRDRFVRWPTLWPLKNRQDIRNTGKTLSAYLLVHPDEAPTYIAHNPLQQITYSGVYLMSLLQVVTGFALYGLNDPRSNLWRWFQLPVTWIGAPDVRLIHYLVMLAFWVFLVLHIYLAVRADTVDRNGGVSSMLSGGVWLRRGSHPVDDPSL
jgi:Ni/Fe-hydrogenase b-type cytochrome subunit